MSIFGKKRNNFGKCQKTKFFNFRASQNEEKTFLDQKKIPPRYYYAYMNHQKIFQSGLTSGSAGLRKNMRDPPTDMFWSPLLYLKKLRKISFLLFFGRF